MATLFIGEEEHGVWSLDLSDQQSKPQSVDTIAAANGLVMDVEGMSLWLGEDGKFAALLMRAAPDEIYDMYRVGTEVNSNRASGEGLVAPIG